MANIRRWSQTATGNATVAGGASTINFAEGQLPSTVNNSAREMMAQIRGVYKPSEWGWVECSATASVASQTTFKLTGDQTGDYTAGRRWRIKSASTTRYGSIVSSSYTTETTVTVTVDSGSLSASHSLAAVAAIDSNHIPSNTYVTSNSLSAALASLGTYLTSNSASVALALKQNSILFQDEGVALSATGAATTINFVGAGFSASLTSGTLTITSGQSGGITDLGNISTASGASATLGSLDLTTYKFLRLVLEAVVFSGASNFLVGNSTADDVNMFNATIGSGGQTANGFIDIDLATGKSITSVWQTSGTPASLAFASTTPVTTSSTGISVATSTGTFSGGNVSVFGMK